jgi:hypothetical protein
MFSFTRSEGVPSAVSYLRTHCQSVNQQFKGLRSSAGVEEEEGGRSAPAVREGAESCWPHNVDEGDGSAQAGLLEAGSL